MKSILSRALVFLTLSFFISTSAIASKGQTPEKIKGTTRITAEDIIKLVEQHENLVIIDARAEKDRMATGHIEGSIGLPDTKTNKKALTKYIPSKSTPVIFYCNGVKCGRSVKSAKLAVKSGYKKVYWFRGGWEEWANKGLPVSR